ncbi:MAG: hypothetical protein K9I59_09825 [Chlorobium sp.]|jgi:predicted peroxiredoxin|uniref:hypothetical protein n=1 Tax=Chlorobium sp. TaxID=1095 RepID=UPI0025BBCFD0|nr:hypothetical protein [Chlorobium sp.]MCF8217116.1 hypothetical protein [Chlorobium sp.]MCF8271962.1 hypothetical protein [Chlorobium sp.]MCF8288333.1 hypothetical protein [Chlorobium sp.]MCF8291922.1 hypothetical protein [Chlorobium sp.]MCF8386029.1 hypothetical protein [Chlorobium sp.]
MNRITKNFAKIALLGLLFLPAAPAGAEEKALASQPASAALDATRGLFVVITEADPMTQMMALVLSTQTVEQGKSVQILLCGPGGDLAMQKSSQVMMKPLNKSPQMLLQGLIAKGVVVEVCPLYLPNKGKKAEDLINGVSVAKPPVVAKNLRAEGIKLFTF